MHIWLLLKAKEGGKGPSVLDKGGQGVLHFAAALGYDWALQPTKLAGVSANFRDVMDGLHFIGRHFVAGEQVSCLFLCGNLCLGYFRLFFLLPPSAVQDTVF